MLRAMYPDDPDTALEVATHLARAGRVEDAQREIDRLRALPPPFGDSPSVDFAEIDVAMARGDRHRDEALARHALSTAVARGLDADAALARFSIVRSLIAQGDNTHVEPLIDEARADFERLGDKARLADVLLSSARVKRRNLDLEGARAQLTTVLEIEEQQGAIQRQATVLLDLAGVSDLEGDHRRAKAGAEEGARARTTRGPRLRWHQGNGRGRWLGGGTEHPRSG